MNVLAIELNDAGLRAARSGDDELLPLDGGLTASPGVVRLRATPIVTGVAASRQAAEHPTGSRFWDQLGTEPNDPSDPRSPNRAEVACAHLEQVLARVGAAEAVVLAAPVHYDRRQLGILAGIAREQTAPLRAVVARPIALVPEQASGERVLVVELGLHRAVITTVEVAGRVSMVATRSVADVSLDRLRRRWIDVIGDEFVRTTRFDPLQEPAIEQQLRDQLEPMLAAIDQGHDYEIALTADRNTYRATLTAQRLAHAGHELIFRLCDEIRAASEGIGSILLDHESASVPGLRDAVERQTTRPLATAAAGAAALQLARFWPSRFVEPDAGPDAGRAVYYPWRDDTPAVAS